MDLIPLLDALSQPSAYPLPAEVVEVHQTHLSAVFLAGPYAYKIKKPLDVGFVDFTALAARRHYCLEEVRLNRRLAPRVYLGVLPVALRGGELRVGGEGEPVEWAVWMVRLPAEATLEARLAAGSLPASILEHLGRRLADFHGEAERGPQVSAFGRWAAVAGNCRENFEQTETHAGVTVSRPVQARLTELTELALSRFRTLIDRRAAEGRPCDTHGDLRLEHVYWFPDLPRPDDLAVVDCIEFNERFRFGDPLADVAFLAMDLAFRGRRDLAEAFCRAWVEASGDADGEELLPFYTAYRSVVRAKVEGVAAAEPEVPGDLRGVLQARARAHWLLALGALEEPARRPCLVLVGGLPGTGKSTLARGLAREGGFRVLSSDRLRKELAGLAPTESGRSAFGEGLYSEAWNDRVYAECLVRAEEALFRGDRVLVDASFREEARRRVFLDAAARWAVPAVLLICRCQPQLVRGRLAIRTGDASDADWAIYERAAARWEDGPEGPGRAHAIACDEAAEALASALAVLRAEALA